ncbi:UNVERIFIED_CONTAM: hypothetical protein Slati_2486500 [Sesamum latifolium]|uniref:Retrotransposon gag domain-containing protein n=1 Tax=Sesamum latifolium TaxID=2727402 RepID=A0AAW2WE16_9LAMI
MSPVLLARGPITWDGFKEAFLWHYFPNAVRLQKMAEFDALIQTPNMSVVEYLPRFHTLGKYSPTIMADPLLKIHKCNKGLKGHIQTALAIYEARSFDELLGAAIRAEADISRRDTENSLKRPRPVPHSVGGQTIRRPALTINKRVALPTTTSPMGQIEECGHCHKKHVGKCR